MNVKIYFILLVCIVPLVSSRSFTIDYENNCFMKDGVPFRYVSGSIHYFRVPWQYWQDRVYKMKMAGLNAIQTYVEWNHHEPVPGIYNFKDNYNLTKFLQIVHDLDMLVILRPGPFIDAERDMGGLPYWLLKDTNITLRSFDKTYITHVNRWFSVLAHTIEPFLYSHGGPIITVQIENEFGSIGSCDAQYKSHLRDFFRHKLKNKVALFTTDGYDSTALTCGKTDEVLSTVDFGIGVDVKEAFQLLRWHQASGPLVNSEFYPGWLDHWGQDHANVSTDCVVKTLTDILSQNASVNIYMFHGGTSFGFSAGSNIGTIFQSCPTSYDYDAPLSEAGDPTPKYFAMRDVIGKFLPLPPGPLPKPSPKLSSQPIAMTETASLLKYAERNSHSILADYPKSFEELNQPYGFVVYATQIHFQTSDPAVLTVHNISDRGYVFVNNVLQGILSRMEKIDRIPIRVLKGDNIAIIVENQGRICSGPGVNDRKGIFTNVTLGTQVLHNWKMIPINLNESNILKLPQQQNSKDVPSEAPAFYSGFIKLSEGKIKDTFLRLDGWHKGVAFINGFNLGRYWPIVGPQITLYVPGTLLKPTPAVNTITLLELERAPCDSETNCVVRFVDTPVVNGTTPEDTIEKAKKRKKLLNHKLHNETSHGVKLCNYKRA